jgi:hypothetical protein
MTSNEFYQLMDRALEPECRRLGLSRARGKVSLWLTELRTGTLFYQVAKGVKNPYIPLLGGRFKVECDVTPSRNRRDRGCQTAVSYMEYYSSSDLAIMREIQDQVLHKIVAQQPAGEFERLMLEAHIPMLRMQIGSEFRRHGVFAVPYLDAEDVSAWGGFLASRLEQTVIGVQENPVFFMRPGKQPDGDFEGN